jgi:hypothetical protein
MIYSFFAITLFPKGGYPCWSECNSVLRIREKGLATPMVIGKSKVSVVITIIFRPRFQP